MKSPVPFEQFGRDHWSLLFYIEDRCVNAGGRIEPSKLRGLRQRPPTVLRDGSTVKGHYDADCLDDMAHAGLFELDEGRYGEPNARLSAYGWQVAAALRRHSVEQGSLATFVPPPFPVRALLSDTQIEVLRRTIAIYCDERADIDKVLVTLGMQDWDAFWARWVDEEAPPPREQWAT